MQPGIAGERIGSDKNHPGFRLLRISAQARAEPGTIKSDDSKENESTPEWGAFVLEAPPGIGPGMKVLQTSALPLGYGAG